MTQALAPQVRSQFAQRLKSLRTRRGFDRARYFAQTLGIEENRYTRYERAEVEPNLTLIHKMCETLQVSPNELLGFADPGDPRPDSVPAFAETLQEEIAGDKAVDPVGSLAWNLAAQAVAMRREHGGRSKSAADPLAVLRETSALFRSLQLEPFNTVAAILNEDIDAKHEAKLAEYDPGVYRQRQRGLRSAPALMQPIICGSRPP